MIHPHALDNLSGIFCLGLLRFGVGFGLDRRLLTRSDILIGWDTLLSRGAVQP